MDDEVFQFTAQFFGVKPESLSAQTRPWPDLCEDEQRAEAFLWRFSQRFGVSFPKLNNRQSVAYLALCGASFLRRCLTVLTVGVPGLGLMTEQKAAGEKFGPFPPLTLGELIAAATRAAPRPGLSGTPSHTAE